MVKEKLYKGLISALLVFIVFIIPVSGIRAADFSIKDKITDTSSIERDFKVLNINIDDYHPFDDKANIAQDIQTKLYIVGYSERYIDEENVQCYLYVYYPYAKKNPIKQFDSNLLFYDETIYNIKQGVVFDEHCLAKIKIFTRPVKEEDQISIQSIKLFNYNYSRDYTNWLVEYRCSSDSDGFVIQTKHPENQEYVNISYMGTMIIEEYMVVKVSISEDDNFFNAWNSILEGGYEHYLDVYFYNFNFPKDITVDNILSAKFNYDYHHIYKNESNAINDEKHYFKDLTDFYKAEIEPRRDQEYTPGKKILRVNNNSVELDFDTFYLGNRVKDEKFYFKNKISDIDEEKFDYDCSILLDSTFRKEKWYYHYPNPLIAVGEICGYKTEYTTLDDIEFIELTYDYKGTVHKKQIAAPSVDESEIVEGGTIEDVPKSLFDQIIDFLKTLFEGMGFNWNVVVMWFYIIVGVVAFILLFSILGKLSILVKIIVFPFKMIGQAVNFIKNMFSKRKIKKYYPYAKKKR